MSRASYELRENTVDIIMAGGSGTIVGTIIGVINDGMTMMGV